MSDIKKRIDEALEKENINGLQKLYEKLLPIGSTEEKEALADAFMSMFGQCQYDFMCGKYDDEEGIWEMFDWVEKVKTLCPEMDDYHNCRGHVYDMLAEVNTNQKETLELLDLSLKCFQAQQKVTPNDSDIWIDLAKAIIERCRVEGKYPTSTMTEIKELFVEAITMERKLDDQPGYIGFKGRAIAAFLNTAYELLLNPESGAYHSQFLLSFKTVLTPYLKNSPVVAYRWSDTLIRIIDWPKDRKLDPAVLGDNFEKEAWATIDMLLKNLKDLTFSDEYFPVTVGHVFKKVALKHKNAEYLDQAIAYYIQAHQLHDESWAYPYYAAKGLNEKAVWLLEKDQEEEAKACFDQGLAILDNAEGRVEHFQFNLEYGKLLYEYAGLFEAFSNKDTLLKCREQFEKSESLGQQFYVQPYYGLAKVSLLLDGTAACLDILRNCGEIFSNEYYTHDYREIIDDPDFKEIQNEIPIIIESIKKNQKDDNN